MKNKTIIIIVIIAVATVGLVLAGLYLIGGSTEELTNLTMTEDIDTDYEPIGETTTFEFNLNNQSSEDHVYLTADMISPLSSTELYSIWYGPDGEVIWDFENQVFDESVWGDKDEYDVYWDLSPPAHQWEEGDHSIEVILNGEVVETVEFEVVDTAEGSEEVTDLTLSKDFDYEEYEPIEEATVFKDNETVFFSGVVQNPEVGMELYTKWYAEEGESGEQEMVYSYENESLVLEEGQVGDNTTIVFPVRSIDVIWTSGDHWVELFIDGEKVATLDFRIEESE